MFSLGINHQFEKPSITDTQDGTTSLKHTAIFLIIKTFSNVSFLHHNHHRQMKMAKITDTRTDDLKLPTAELSDSASASLAASLSA